MAKKQAKPTPIIIANWKMNGLLLESMQLFKTLRKNILNSLVGCEIVICPPATLLRDMAEKVPGTGVKLGGQNCHYSASGAFTGDISAAMLRDMTCDYVILGHSERRMYHNESSELVGKKAATAHGEKLTTIICVGETEYERDHHLAKDTIKQQLTFSVPESANDKNTIIAYEPVWAIGSGRTPTHTEISEMHTFIHEIISAMPQFDKGIRIVYGGSVSGENAKELLSAPGVEGLLVGRASLDVDEFWNIIQTASA